MSTLVLGALWLAAACARGETGTEVFGSLGAARWWDNEGAAVSGIQGGGGIGRRLLPQFALEGEVRGFRGRRGNSSATFDYRTGGVQVTGNGVLTVVRRTRTAIFVLLGAGATHTTREIVVPGYRNRRSSSGFIATAGAGVKVRLSRRLSLRPEVRITGGRAGSAGGEPFSAELSASVGLGYRW